MRGIRVKADHGNASRRGSRIKLARARFVLTRACLQRRLQEPGTEEAFQGWSLAYDST